MKHIKEFFEGMAIYSIIIGILALLNIPMNQEHQWLSALTLFVLFAYSTFTSSQLSLMYFGMGMHAIVNTVLVSLDISPFVNGRQFSMSTLYVIILIGMWLLSDDEDDEFIE